MPLPSVAVALFWAVSGVPDAGTADGGLAVRPPATKTSTQTAIPTPAEIDNLQRENAALAQLVRGELPAGYEIRSLFEVDLRNPAAIEARRETLNREVDVYKQRRRDLLGGTDTASAAAPLRRDDAARLAFADAKLKRTRLRLEFLAAPATFRETLLHTEERQRSIRDARQEAEAARAEAEQDGLRAEQARQKAIEEARTARTAAERGLAAERARLEAYRVTLAGLRGDLASSRERWASTQSDLLEEHNKLTKPAYDPKLTPEDADKIFDQLIPVFSEGHRQFAEALDRINADSRVDRFVPEIDSNIAGISEFAQIHDEIRADVIKVQKDAAELAEAEADLRFQRAEGFADDLSHLNQVRLDLLPRLSDTKRKRTLGFTEPGFRQLLIEAGHVRDMAQWYVVERLERPSRAQGLRSYVTVGLAGLELLKLIILLVVALWLRKHHKRGLAGFRVWALKRIDNRNVRLLADRWLRFLQANAFSAGFLIFAYLFFDFGGWKLTEVRILRAVVVSYAWYRFLRALAFHMITEAAQAGRVNLQANRRERIHASVSLVCRYLLVVAIFLLASKEIVGGGYLYGLVRSFFWLGSIPLALILIRRWRTDIADTYLKMYPKGRFARSVEATRDRASGFFVVLAAFGSVAARGIATYFKRTALQFEQTRRALAFLFRRRLEKQAAEQGLLREEAELPEALREAFSEEEASVDHAIDHYPGLTEVVAHVEELASDEKAEGEAYALVGERGAGKTSWLDELCRRNTKLPIVRIPLPDRPSPKALLERVADAFGADSKSTPEDLITHIKEGEPRLVIIDGCQNLMLRCVGGTLPYESLMDVVSRTTQNVVWVLAFSRYSWRHLEARYSGRNLFTSIIHLNDWTEEQIGRLISKRMAMTNYKASYEDLVVDRVEGTSFDTAIVRTRERFNRLLWDYSDGNPRIALHFWKHAITVEGADTVRVRMFAYPPEEDLAKLGESERFILTAIAIHENLTAEELSLSIGYPTAFCKSVINYLEQANLLERRGPRVRIDTHYYRTVVRFLRRNHLLHG